MNEQSAPMGLGINEVIATISTEYIELDKLLKKENLVASGGEARYCIVQGLVWVNDVLETRKRRKMYPGDMLSFNGTIVRVKRAPLP